MWWLSWESHSISLDRDIWNYILGHSLLSDCWVHITSAGKMDKALVYIVGFLALLYLAPWWMTLGAVFLFIYFNK